VILASSFVSILLLDLGGHTSTCCLLSVLQKDLYCRCMILGVSTSVFHSGTSIMAPGICIIL